MDEAVAPRPPGGAPPGPAAPGRPITLARVGSVNVGQPQERRLPSPFPEADRVGVYQTAIVKTPASGPVRVTSLHLAGDAQADLRNHGGADKAVHAHFAQHLDWWGQRRGYPVRPGELGENLTLGAAMHPSQALPSTPPDSPLASHPAAPPAALPAALPDEAAFCIGDVLRVGSALLQVTQPRIPCYKQAAQLGLVDAVRLIAETARCGLYLRVLQEGALQAGDTVQLVDRPHPDVTVADAHRFVHQARHDRELRARLLGCTGLGRDIRRRLEE